jgi:hypothetical protein
MPNGPIVFDLEEFDRAPVVFLLGSGYRNQAILGDINAVTRAAQRNALLKLGVLEVLVSNDI